MDWLKLSGKIIALALVGVNMTVGGRNTQTDVFEPTFKSLQITDPNNLLGQPIIVSTNADSKVRISFDEIAEDQRYMRYSLIHCDAQWRPSGLVLSLIHI